MPPSSIDIGHSVHPLTLGRSTVALDPGRPRSGRVGLEPSDPRRAQLERRLFPSLASEPVRVGRFVLTSRLGAGGMGEVFAAYDEQLDRRVAIKLLRRDAPEHAGARERLLQEAKALACLSHPHVVQVHEAGVIDGRVFVAMELVEGPTLGEHLQRHAPPLGRRRRWPVVLELFTQAARGLAAAHALGLVHRDFKPDNVLVGADGRVRVVDFGLARLVEPLPLEEVIDDERTASAPSLGTRPRLRALTETGMRLGTFAYMAPEQLTHGVVDERCDQFGFCVALYEALYGTRPFAGRTTAARLLEIHSGLPRAHGHVPRWLHRVLRRGLAYEPAHRFAGMDALLAALTRARRSRRRALAVLLGSGATALALAMLQPRPNPCALDASALAGTWDEERRAAVAEAFASTGLGLEASTASVEQALDRWSDQWRAAQRDACEATRVTGVQSEARLDRRVACLERKRREAGALLDVLVEADATTVAHAPELIGRLPGLEACASVDALEERFPLPSDPARRAAIEEGFEQLARVGSLASAGHLERASTLAQAVRARTEALAYPPLSLAVEGAAGELALVRRDFEAAVPQLLDVARKAERARLDELVASVRVTLVGGTIGKWSHPEQEAWLLADAEAAVDRLGHDHDPRALELVRARANLLENAGDYEAALGELQRVGQRARPLDDDAIVALATRDRAEILRQLARYDDAATEFERARATAGERWGSRSPAVADIELELAALEIERGRHEPARAHLARADEIQRAVQGPESYAVARVQLVAAKLAMNEGELAKARALVERSLDAHVRELGPTHELVGDVQEALGVLRFFDHDLDGSLDAYRRALAIRERMLAPDHPTLGLLHSNIGESLAARGDHDGALASYSEALRILGRALPPDHPNLALPLKGRAQSNLALGRARDAANDLERALALLQGGDADEPYELADTRFSLARALASQGREPTRARRLAEQALAAFDALGHAEPARATRAWLATH